MYAAQLGHADVVQLLLSSGAKIQPELQGTAMLLSALHGNLEIAKFSLKHGADVNLATSNGQTALITAQQSGTEYVVKVLLSYGAKIQPELQGDAMVEVALTLIAEERAEARVVGHELLNQQPAMPPEIVKLCCSYVSAQSLDQKEFVSVAELRA